MGHGELSHYFLTYSKYYTILTLYVRTALF